MFRRLLPFIPSGAQGLVRFLFGLALLGGPAAAQSPQITVQPLATNVAAGATVALQVSADAMAPLTYQWFQNGKAINGATAATFQYVAVKTNNAGFYYAVVSNPAGSVTSSVVSLTVGLPGSETVLTPRGSLGGFKVGDGSGAPVRIQIRGRYAYVADGWDTGLYIVDVGDPDHPQSVAKIPVVGKFGAPFDVALIDHFALIAERGDGLGIIDVSNPTAPVRIGNIKVPGSLANSVTVRDRLAYLGNEEAGLVIYDVSDPAKPVLIGQSKAAIGANGLGLGNGTAVVAGWTSGFSLMDVSNPSDPQYLGSYPAVGKAYTGYAFDAVISGLTAYVANINTGVELVDLSDPTNMTLVGRAFGNVWDLALMGRRLFTADTFYGLRVVDVSNPTNAVPIGSVSPWGAALGLKLHGNRLFLGGRTFGVIDLSFPAMSPIATVQPEARRVAAGSSVVLEAAAAGTEPLSFRWFHNNQEIEGETAATLTLPATGSNEVGEYSVIVRNALSSTTYVVANLDLEPSGPPALTIESVGQGLRISWSQAFTGYHLESVGDLALGASWTAVGQTPTQGGGVYNVIVPEGGATRFFRLSKP